MKKTLAIIISTAILTSGCWSDSTPKKVNVLKPKPRTENVKNVTLDYYSLPSPMEIASAIKKTGVGYEPKILHKSELGSRYSTNRAMALNLGIYGTDLSYSIYFDQQQEAMKYLGCVKNLASNLDISNVLSEAKIKTIEENIQDKEMLKKIISQTFFHSDAFLKENSRSETAAMIMFGMWIESMYISTQLTEGNINKNPALSQCIIEQQYVFETLIGLLKTLEKNNDINTISDEINQLGVEFDALTKNINETTKDKNKLESEDFNKLCTSIEKIRTDYTMLF